MPDGGNTATARRAEIVNLPNAISFARLCAVPAAVWLTLRHQLAATFVLFAAAGISDALDGWLARRRGGTPLGAFLDPLADKALLVSMVLALAWISILPDWLVILIVFRDLLIVAGLLAMWRLSVAVRIRPLAISKLNTGFQLVLVAAALFLRGFAVHAAAADLFFTTLVWLTAATTLLSGAAYVWKGARGAWM